MKPTTEGGSPGEPLIPNQTIPKRALAVLLGATFVSLFGVGIIVPILPLYAVQLGASGFLLGVITASFSVASAVAQPSIGAYSDRWGRKPFLLAGLTVYALAGVGYALAGSIWALMALRAVQGVGAAMIFPVAMAYIGDRTPREREGFYMGLYNVAVFGGIGAGPVIGGLFKDSLGIHAAFYAMGIASAVAMVLILLLLKEQPLTGRWEERVPMWTAFRTMIRSRRIQAIFTLRLGVQLVAVPTFVFLPLFMTMVIGASGVQVGIIITIRTLVNACLQPVFGWVGDRYSKVAMSVAACIVMTVTVVFIGLSSAFWHLVVLFAILGLAEAVILPSLSGMAVEEGRSFGMGYTMGVFNTVMNLGIFGGSMLAGLAVDEVGMTPMYVGVAGILAVAIIASGWLFRHDRPNRISVAPIPARVGQRMG